MIRTVAARMEDWCISRQRFWGVPIPAFYHKTTGEALMNEQTVEAFLKRMDQTNQGVACWWSSSEAQLLPEGVDASEWVKGTDTMDVWMDSGLSWAHQRDSGRATPCNVVLEGNDQYRGWFQSSLLTWVAAGNKGAPFKTVAVHGFCLDSHGVKMSKSVGNVIPPRAVTHGAKSLPGEPKGFEANGVDVLRMWVASHDWTLDMNLSRLAVDAVAKHYRKVRNTLRWLLGSLQDFDPAVESLSNLNDARQGYVAQHLHFMVAEAHEAVERDYANLNFASVTQRVAEFISDLSSLQVETMKDSLYCNEPSHWLRRSNQRALLEALRFLVDTLLPILPHTMADLTQHAPAALGLSMRSNYRRPNNNTLSLPLEWNAMCELRSATNRLLETARNAKMIGSPLDAIVELNLAAGSKLRAPLEALGEETPCFFGAVSAVRLVDSLSSEVGSAYSTTVQLLDGSESVGLAVTTVTEGSSKCPRCWVRGTFETEFCARCAQYECVASRKN